MKTDEGLYPSVGKCLCPWHFTSYDPCRILSQTPTQSFVLHNTSIKPAHALTSHRPCSHQYPCSVKAPQISLARCYSTSQNWKHTHWYETVPVLSFTRWYHHHQPSYKISLALPQLSAGNSAVDPGHQSLIVFMAKGGLQCGLIFQTLWSTMNLHNNDHSSSRSQICSPSFSLVQCATTVTVALTASLQKCIRNIVVKVYFNHHSRMTWESI